MYRILISNTEFGNACPEALILLKENAIVIENKDGIRFCEEDFINYGIHDIDVLIVGTEKVSKRVISEATKLKLIGRLGVGVDSIDLESTRRSNINICYTPNASSAAVPEFTIALILNLIKGISFSDREMHKKVWFRPMGRSLSACKFGIVGTGKIGKKVIKLLLALEPSVEVFFYDPNVEFIAGAKKVPLHNLFQTCDVISLHVPLNDATNNLISKELLGKLPKGSYLINTSRGGIIDEASLYHALQTNLAGAAIDVFDEEPYSGPLCELENCILTSHIGSMTIQARTMMEMQIAEDVINFISNIQL